MALRYWWYSYCHHQDTILQVGMRINVSIAVGIAIGVSWLLCALIDASAARAPETPHIEPALSQIETNSSDITPVARDASFVNTARLQALDGFKACKSGASRLPIATVLGVQVTPAIAKQGDHVNVAISFTTPQRIMNGKIETSFLFGSIELGTDVADLCSMLASSTPASHCPLAAGSYALSHGFVIPTEAPSNKYSIRVSITSFAGESLACFVTSVRVG